MTNMRFAREMRSLSTWPRTRGNNPLSLSPLSPSHPLPLPPRTGALRARLVRLVQPAKVETVEGVIKTLKDSFGFIERADMIKDVSYCAAGLLMKGEGRYLSGGGGGLRVWLVI